MKYHVHILNWQPEQEKHPSWHEFETDTLEEAIGLAFERCHMRFKNIPLRLVHLGNIWQIQTDAIWTYRNHAPAVISPIT